MSGDAIFIPHAERLYSEIAAIPQLARGLVWCTTCGRSQEVVASYRLRYGWPKCCGHTMTIDSPEERRALTQGDKSNG